LVCLSPIANQFVVLTARGQRGDTGIINASGRSGRSSSSDIGLHVLAIARGTMTNPAEAGSHSQPHHSGEAESRASHRQSNGAADRASGTDPEFRIRACGARQFQ
jgi:hypothetical protein